MIACTAVVVYWLHNVKEMREKEKAIRELACAHYCKFLETPFMDRVSDWWCVVVACQSCQQEVIWVFESFNFSFEKKKKKTSSNLFSC